MILLNYQMLTGDETVTSGNAFVGGFSVLSNLREAQQNLGWSYFSFVDLIKVRLRSK